MKKSKAFSSITVSNRLLLIFLLSILVAGCIVIEAPSESGTSSGPRAPASVQKMQKLGYTFTYYSEDDHFWESKNSTQGWALRIWEDGAFGMSGQFDKDFDAQTEASVDFFESLGITPEQASLTVQLTIEAMGNLNGEASDCDGGLCCHAQVVESQQIYIWYCEQ